MRRHLKATLLLVAGFCAVGALGARAVESLSLSDVYGLAVEQSEELQIGVSEWRAAEARYRQAVGGMWPEVRIAGGAILRDGGEGTSREDHDYRIGAAASWEIFNGFRTLREAESLQSEGKALQFDNTRMRQLLYQDVADVFYQVLDFEGELAALAGQVEALNERAADLEERVKLGKSRRAELLSAQAQLARTLVTAEELKGLRAAAREVLAFLTGRPAESLQLADATALPAQENVDRFLAAAAQRPDVLAAESRVEASARNVEAARAERLPQIVVGGNAYAWRDPEDVGDWDIALQAELPVFDRGIRRALVAERSENMRVSELRLAQLRRSTELDVRSACQQLLSALAQWSALEDAVKISGADYETQKSDYEMGRTANIDVLASLIQLHGLRQQQVSLDMQVRAAMVRLHVAAGAVAP